jgi:5-formyltetrahydrofolate cyclo-ligase
MDKKELRRLIKQKLAELSPQERSDKSKQICQHLIHSEVFQKAAVVMAFLSMPHEVDTTPIILNAWQQGKTVAVPKVSWSQRHMIPVEIQSLETGVETGRNGLRNPTGGVPVPFEDIDLVLTPGLGFDRSGNRLGRGGAYYDRFFRSPTLRAARWALSFSLQVLDRIPVNEEDVPVDAIVTETGIYPCANEIPLGG